MPFSWASLKTVSTPPPVAPVAIDIVCFGVLMMVSGLVDLYIIWAYPRYALPFFGTRFSGAVGLIYKLISPCLHFISGYGAIYGRRWAYLFFMGYGLYGLTNAMVNRMMLPPPHRIRTIFIIGILVVMGYLYKRRNQFVK